MYNFLKILTIKNKPNAFKNSKFKIIQTHQALAKVLFGIMDLNFIDIYLYLNIESYVDHHFSLFKVSV